MEKVLTELLTGSNTRKSQSFGIWLVLTTGITMQKEGGQTAFQRMRGLMSPYTYTQLGAVWKTFMSFIHVDDRYDTMTPEAILAHGPRPELREDDISEFAKHFLKPEEIQAFHDLGKFKHFTPAQINRHLNIVTQMMWDEADAAHTYQQTGSVEARNTLRDYHMKMTQFIYFTFNMIMNAPGKGPDTIDFKTYADMEKAYPVGNKMGLITQLFDDVYDTMRDLHEEIHYGRPSGNAVLAVAHEKFGLWESQGKMKPVFEEVYQKYLRQKKPVPLAALPVELRESIAIVKRQFLENLESLPISRMTKIIFKSSFESMLKEGLNCPVRYSRGQQPAAPSAQRS
jgi:hypothetical protein